MGIAVTMQDLAGRVALVTAGARGAGLAVAAALHARGAAVVIADSGADPAGDGADPTIAPAAARELGARAAAFADSVASPSAAAGAVGLAFERFGALDILVHSAAMRRDGGLGTLAPLDWEAVLRANLSAGFYLLRAAVPLLAEQARSGRAHGRIIALGVAGGPPGEAAAWSGLVGLIRAAAPELAGIGATANAVLAARPADAAVAAAVIAGLAAPAGAGITGRLHRVGGGRPPQAVPLGELGI